MGIPVSSTTHNYLVIPIWQKKCVSKLIIPNSKSVLMACVSIGFSFQYWFLIPVLVSHSSIGFSFQYWFLIPVLVACASIGGLCQYWWLVPVLVACASIGDLCQYWWLVPVLVACASISRLCQYCVLAPVLMACIYWLCISGGKHALRNVCVPLDVNISLQSLREALDKSQYTTRSLQHSRRLLILYLAGQQNGKYGEYIPNRGR